MLRAIRAAKIVATKAEWKLYRNKKENCLRSETEKAKHTKYPSTTCVSDFLYELNDRKKRNYHWASIEKNICETEKYHIWLHTCVYFYSAVQAKVHWYFHFFLEKFSTQFLQTVDWTQSLQTVKITVLCMLQLTEMTFIIWTEGKIPRFLGTLDVKKILKNESISRLKGRQQNIHS